LRKLAQNAIPRRFLNQLFIKIRQEFVTQIRDKSTAANHDTIKAMVTTWKIERVYSPVLDAAVAIGKKPAAVIKVPVNIGKAVVSTHALLLVVGCSLAPF
jgi:hypothetical protein